MFYVEIWGFNGGDVNQPEYRLPQQVKHVKVILKVQAFSNKHHENLQVKLPCHLLFSQLML